MPYWQMTRCREPIHTDCPAYRHSQYPCWEIEGTYCKWDRWGTLGRGTSICLAYEVYLKLSESKHIELNLGDGASSYSLTYDEIRLHDTPVLFPCRRFVRSC